jgi:hypothetical protein
MALSGLTALDLEYSLLGDLFIYEHLEFMNICDNVLLVS